MFCGAKTKKQCFIQLQMLKKKFLLSLKGVTSWHGVKSFFEVRQSVKWVNAKVEQCERRTQTNPNLPTGWEQRSVCSENGWGGRLMAGAGETGLEAPPFMHNGPWEAPFSPVAEPFTGPSSPVMKRTPHASSVSYQSTFLSHHSPTAVSGWRCHYLDSFTDPCLWRAWFC